MLLLTDPHFVGMLSFKIL